MRKTLTAALLSAHGHRSDYAGGAAAMNGDWKQAGIRWARRLGVVILIVAGVLLASCVMDWCILRIA